MRQIIIYILLFIQIDSFGQDNSAITNFDNYCKTGYRLLDSAYCNKNTKYKEQFFKEWFNYSQKFEKKYNKQSNTIVQSIQYFFKDIYFPDRDTINGFFQIQILDKQNRRFIRQKIQDNGTFIKAKYYILQPTVNYYVCHDTIIKKIINEHNYPDSINKFEIECIYPNVTFMDKKRLYLTKYYYSILDSFILKPIKTINKSKSYSIDDNNNNELLADSRRVFLKPEIEISKSHDGGVYHYETFPNIHAIYFNNSFNIAIVVFRSSFNTGGYAKYEKTNNFWRREEYKRVSSIQ